MQPPELPDDVLKCIIGTALLRDGLNPYYKLGYKGDTKHRSLRAVNKLFRQEVANHLLAMEGEGLANYMRAMNICPSIPDTVREIWMLRWLGEYENKVPVFKCGICEARVDGLLTCKQCTSVQTCLHAQSGEGRSTDVAGSFPWLQTIGGPLLIMSATVCAIGVLKSRH